MNISLVFELFIHVTTPYYRLYFFLTTNVTTDRSTYLFKPLRIYRMNLAIFKYCIE
jgi:hypothetical protein